MSSKTTRFGISETLPATPIQPQGFVFRIVGAAAFAHLLNDLIQAMLPAIFPLLKADYALSFGQIGMIALVYQITASLLQPWIGLYTDKRPMPYLLPGGMGVTFLGIALLAGATSYPLLLLAASIIGIGSAVFHPEASRVARLASGGRFGTAQSTFQVGGNTGSAIGPLLAAAIVIPYGQPAVAWFMLAAAAAIWILWRITKWNLRYGLVQAKRFAGKQGQCLSRSGIIRAIVVIAILMFAKFIYIAAFTNYFTFYLIERFQLAVQESQIFLFIFWQPWPLEPLQEVQSAIVSAAKLSSGCRS